MFTPDNEQRAERAEAALSAYAKVNDSFVSDESNITDLLTDLMHYAGREEFTTALRMAEIHYDCELTGKE